jgi:hypothetical protein
MFFVNRENGNCSTGFSRGFVYSLFVYIASSYKNIAWSKMTEINHENVLIQLKDALNGNGIKLWEEPYCVAGESNENEINVSEIVIRFMPAMNVQISLFHRVLPAY